MRKAASMVAFLVVCPVAAKTGDRAAPNQARQECQAERCRQARADILTALVARVAQREAENRALAEGRRPSPPADPPQPNAPQPDEPGKRPPCRPARPRRHRSPTGPNEPKRSRSVPHGLKRSRTGRIGPKRIARDMSPGPTTTTHSARAWRAQAAIAAPSTCRRRMPREMTMPMRKEIEPRFSPKTARPG